MDRNDVKYRVRLVFAEGPTFKQDYSPHPKSFKRRMIRSHPHLLFWMFGVSLIHRLTKSRASHILISDGEVVLDYQFASTKFWPYIPFTRRHRGILGYIDIYSDVPPMLERWEGRANKDSWWRCLYTLAKYLTAFFTRGMVSGTNCVTITRQICAEADLKIPKSYFSPALLRRWLIDHGTDYIAGAPSPHD